MININDKKIVGAVHNAMYQQWKQRGYATPVDTLIYIGVLSKQSYEEWRFGRIPYLEKACTANLRKLSVIMHQMRVYAKKSGWKTSFCYYKRWNVKKKGGQGRKPVIPLRFSKSGDPNVEKWYSTHFVDTDKIKQLKAEKSNTEK